MAATALRVKDDLRGEPRDEVHYRTRAIGPDGRPLTLLLVNLSSHGLMARCETDYGVGERLRITLPTQGIVMAEIRWSLGGRLGCQLDRPIPLAAYFQLLAAIARG